MAICNNLGHCCAHAFDSRSVNLCRERIDNILERYWDQLEDEGMCLEQDLAFFYSNRFFCGTNYIEMAISPAA
jgi:hypothetical protein